MPKLEKVVTAREFHAWLRYPRWHAFSKAIYQTRSYENGFSLALMLFELQRVFEARFPPNINALHYSQIGAFALECLYRANRWQEYIDFAEQIRTRCPPYFNVYAPKDEVLRTHGDRILPYVLSEIGDGLRVHFSYAISYRLAKAQRKLALKVAGKSVRNQIYRPRSELTEEEILRRIEKYRTTFTE